MTIKDFPFDENKLKSFLDYFEEVEAINTGVIHESGGFATADYVGYDDDIWADEDEDWRSEAFLYIKLKWGIQNDVDDVVHTERYAIRITEFNKAETNRDIICLLEDA